MCIPGGTNSIGLQGKLAMLINASSAVDEADDAGDRQLL